MNLVKPPPGTPYSFTIWEPYVVYAAHGYFKRVGSCKPDLCGAACCRIVSGGGREHTRYMAAVLGVRTVHYLKRAKTWWFEKPCAQLKGLLCGIQKVKPAVCYQFPSTPSDGHYQVVRNVCSYRFVRITKRAAFAIWRKRDRAIRAWRRRRG